MHEQNMAILKSLVSVAWADGEFADTEREMVEALVSAFDASDDEAKAIREYAATKRGLDDVPVTELSADDRRVLLQHAVLLSYVDGAQHPTERAFIDELAKKLRIPGDEAASLLTAGEERARRFLGQL